jgi:hypothetical protein
MPSITQATSNVTFANLFVSPYGADGIVPLYSSIPITNVPPGDCLPCIVCGNTTTRAQVINEASQSLVPTSVNAVSVFVPSRS